MTEFLPRFVWKLIRNANFGDGGDGGGDGGAGAASDAAGAAADAAEAAGAAADAGTVGTGGTGADAFGAGAQDMSSSAQGVTGAAATGDQGQSGTGFGAGGFGGTGGTGAPSGTGAFGADAGFEAASAAMGQTGAAATGGGLGFGGGAGDGLSGGFGGIDAGAFTGLGPGEFGSNPGFGFGPGDIAIATDAPPDAPPGVAPFGSQGPEAHQFSGQGKGGDDSPASILTGGAPTTAAIQEGLNNIGTGHNFTDIGGIFSDPGTGPGNFVGGGGAIASGGDVLGRGILSNPGGAMGLSGGIMQDTGVPITGVGYPDTFGPAVNPGGVTDDELRRIAQGGGVGAIVPPSLFPVDPITADGLPGSGGDGTPGILGSPGGVGGITTNLTPEQALGGALGAVGGGFEGLRPDVQQLLAQWAQIIPPDDPRWPQVLQLLGINPNLLHGAAA